MPRETLFCTFKQVHSETNGFISKPGFRQFSAQTIHVCKSHVFNSCLFMGKKIIFCVPIKV
jgi:hypothetical protein